MSKLTKFIFASDSHGDMADPEALAALAEALFPPAEPTMTETPSHPIAATGPRTP